MQPMILDSVTREMKLYSEESFGPVVPVSARRHEDEAIRIANDCNSVSLRRYSPRQPRAVCVWPKRIDSGMCHINGPTVHDEAQMPFGGVKDSGYGRFGGKASIAEFTDLRWITVQTGPRHYPI